MGGYAVSKDDEAALRSACRPTPSLRAPAKSNTVVIVPSASARWWSARRRYHQLLRPRPRGLSPLSVSRCEGRMGSVAMEPAIRRIGMELRRVREAGREVVQVAGRQGWVALPDL